MRIILIWMPFKLIEITADARIRGLKDEQSLI